MAEAAPALVLVLGAAILMGAIAAASPSPSAAGERAGGAYPSTPRGRSLLHDGDSLAAGTQPYLRQALPRWRIRASVATSRHAKEAAAILRRYGRRLPRVIVVSLGGNDDPRALGAFRRAIRVMVRVAGRRRCVVWANLVRPPVGGGGYGAMNTVLAQEARRRRNLRVFQWARMARANRHWFGRDRVHPSGVGYRARARGIARIVRRCR